jgi:hypothetical protein
MPLHDWSVTEGWEGVHDIWIVELLRCVKAQLPAGYRAHLGSAPGLRIDPEQGKPDVAVRHWENGNGTGIPPAASPSSEPHRQVVTFELDPNLAVLVTRRGQLAAAIEVISPRNKDRPSARATYLARYLGYLNSRASLLVIDVHPFPTGFSFADALAAELQVDEPPLPSPMAISIRDGGAVPDRGTVLDIWRYPLTPGQPLPTTPLWLPGPVELRVDLEGTYSRAAADAYLT